MTDHRSRKLLIRERMARTGESYTTAHRHVTARRHTNSGSLPGVVAGYPSFGAEQHTPSALSRHLLGQAGLDISEPMACGLGGGIGFLYAIFEYKVMPYPLLTLVMQHHPRPWFEAVTEHLQVTTRTITSSSAHAALAKLDNALDAGFPALLVVARGSLPWHAGGSEVESADAYPIVVAGQAGDEYFVDDRVDEARRIGRDDLAAAWDAHRKGRFALTTVDRLPETVDLPTAIRGALATTAAHLTGPVLDNYFDANMGLAGMAKFAAELRDTTTKHGWTRRFGEPAAVEIAMTRLAECLTWQHTAAGGTRPLYVQFLDEAEGVTGLSLSEATRTCAQSGEIWTQIADLAGSSARDDDPTTVFAAIAELVTVAHDREAFLVRQIEQALI